MRTLTFEQISDGRFGGTENKLNEITNNVLVKLNALTGVKVITEEVRKLDFPDAPSWRQRFYVTKTGRNVTWNEIYAAVNSVKAVPFDFKSVKL
ncbi:hypothetical protein ACMAZF_20220 (plasmid) [Psychrobium sp. nBUS_13]|uniref:hypothetical protein n=1 Tax=Psychrobium sp. nBUS_13 TaxID=3395319 RepID=UPI003EBC9634